MIPEEPLLPDVETWALHAPAPVAPLPCLRLTVHRASVVAGGMSLALVGSSRSSSLNTCVF